ncbi:MAG TPA: hypothetical protein VG347_12200 [Verrucomicrobiae bacterium]|nr:hypothetical protein [Verrucomicrobiae bacterium]
MELRKADMKVVMLDIQKRDSECPTLDGEASSLQGCRVGTRRSIDRQTRRPGAGVSVFTACGGIAQAVKLRKGSLSPETLNNAGVSEFAGTGRPRPGRSAIRKKVKIRRYQWLNGKGRWALLGFVRPKKIIKGLTDGRKTRIPPVFANGNGELEPSYISCYKLKGVGGLAFGEFLRISVVFCEFRSLFKKLKGPLSSAFTKESHGTAGTFSRMGIELESPHVVSYKVKGQQHRLAPSF